MEKSLGKIMYFAPSVLMTVLVVAFAYSLAKFALFVIYGDQSQGVDPTPSEQIITRKESRIMDTSRIADWHLFGEVGVKTENLPKTSVAPETRLRLELTGVYLASDPALSSAIIVDKGKAESYKVGDKLPGGVKLHEVYEDRVIINRNGRLETLRFSEKTLASNVSRQTTKPKITTSSSPSRQNQTMLYDIRQGRVRNSRDVMQRLEQNPKEALSGFINDAGLEPAGEGAFRVSPSAPNDVLRVVGLRKGDIIKNINGYNPEMIQSDPALLQEVIASGSAKIEVQRGKRKFTVNYPLP